MQEEHLTDNRQTPRKGEEDGTEAPHLDRKIANSWAQKRKKWGGQHKYMDLRVTGEENTYMRQQQTER